MLDKTFSLLLICLIGTFLFKSNAYAQYKSVSINVMHNGDLFQIKSPLDLEIDYPKPYNRESVKKHRIHTLSFQDSIIYYRTDSSSLTITDSYSMPVIEYKYTYNRNGDLLTYAENKIIDAKFITICSLNKRYDKFGRLSSWTWLAPPIDSTKKWYEQNSSTLIQKEYGPFNKRCWFERDLQGNPAIIFSSEIRPKEVEFNYRNPNIYKGNETIFSLVHTQFDSNGLPILEKTFQESTDSIALLAAKKPVKIKYISNYYAADKKLKQQINIFNYNTYNGKCSWLLYYSIYEANKPEQLKSLQLFEVSFSEADSAKYNALIRKNQLLWPANGKDSLISSFPIKIELLAEKKLKYDTKSRIIKYVDSFLPSGNMVITREYKKNLIIEKGYEKGNQYWLFRKNKNKLLISEFAAQGFDKNIPQNILAYFPEGRIKAEGGSYFGDIIANFSYKYEGNKIISAVMDKCDSPPMYIFHNKSTPAGPKSCFEPYRPLIINNKYEELLPGVKGNKSSLFKISGSRQQVFNYTITTY